MEEFNEGSNASSTVEQNQTTQTTPPVLEAVKGEIESPTPAAPQPPDGIKKPDVDPKPDLIDDKFEFKKPENLEVNQDSLTKFKEFSIEKGFTKETAQSIFDFIMTARQNAVKAHEVAYEKAVEDARNKIKADPEIGGANYEKIQNAVDKITLKYGGEDFKEQINQSGFKDDAAFLRFIRAIDRATSEDDILTTSQSSDSSGKLVGEEADAEKMFGEFARKIKQSA